MLLCHTLHLEINLDPCLLIVEEGFRRLLKTSFRVALSSFILSCWWERKEGPAQKEDVSEGDDETWFRKRKETIQANHDLLRYPRIFVLSLVTWIKCLLAFPEIAIKSHSSLTSYLVGDGTSSRHSWPGGNSCYSVHINVRNASQKRNLIDILRYINSIHKFILTSRKK